MALDTYSTDGPGPHTPQAAHPPSSPRRAVGEESLRTFGQDVLHRYVRKLRKPLRDLRADDNVEAVHDVRVAIRGLRAVLEMLEDAPGFDRDDLRALRRDLRRLARLLGEVRDLDVLIERVAKDAPDQPNPESIEPLRDWLARKRAATNRRLLKELDRPRTVRLLKDARRLARERSDHHQRGEEGECPILVRHFAGSAVWRRYEDILAFETAMPDADDATLHRLRIACKNLRYVLEPLTEDGPNPHPLVALLKDAQKELGNYHDTVTAVATVERFGASHPDNSDLLAYKYHLEAERDRLHACILPLWHRLSGPDTRRDLAAFIASL